MNTRTKLCATTCLLGTLALQTLAQDAIPASVPGSDPTASTLLMPYLAPVMPSMQDKVIDASLPAQPPGHEPPEPAWDGDKPLLPEMHTPGSDLPAPTMAPLFLDAFRGVARDAFRLNDATVQEGRIAIVNGETRVAIKLGEVEHVVRLHPYSMRATEARLVVQVEGGALVDTPWPEPATFRGTIDGMDADVAASIQNGKASMLILPRNPDEQPWYMQPLSDAIEGMPESLHVVYRASDIAPTGVRCGLDAGFNNEWPEPPPANRPMAQRIQAQLPPIMPAPLPDKNDPTFPQAADSDASNTTGAGPDGSGPDVPNVRCQIALDADYEYYLANGSSVLATIYEMERMMNFVGTIYQSRVAIAYTETFIIIRSNISDPYNTGLTGTGMRDEFRNYWLANHAGVTRDVAVLLSNRCSTDGFIGFAYFAGICNNNNTNNSGHCWASTFWSAVLANKVGTVAHELGHEWNAVHCDGAADCGLMNSSITGSWSFDSVALAAVVAHRDSRPCLDVWQNPTYVNWSWAGVETGSISNPWNTIFEGLDACLVGGTLIVQAGNYLQNPNIFKAKTIQAVNGTVRIGN